MPNRILATAAAALLVVAAVVAAIRWQTDETATGDDRSCGSVLLPVDTWNDCVDRRNAVGVGVALAALGAFGLSVVAIVARRRDPGPSNGTISRDPRAKASVRSRRTIALTAAGAILVAVGGVALVQASSERCGSALTHVVNRPTDRFGNADGDCLDSYERRWLVAGATLTVAAGAFAAAGALRRGRSPSEVVMLWATIAGAIALLAVAGLGYAAFGPRGGA
jgi:hypothetical protein